MLTLVAWAAQRARTSIEVEPVPPHHHRGDDQAVLATALEAIDGFLTEIADRSLGLDWFDRPNAGPSASTARLKPNPQNVANQEKKARLDRWVAR